MTRVLTLTICIWLCSAAFLAAVEPAPPAGETLQYYKLLVPEKLFDEKPTIASGFSPYPRDEFWKLLEEARRFRGGSEQTAGPRITRAAYRARWSRESGLKGDEARFEIITDAQTSTLMPLHPLGIATGAVVWDEQPPRPALIGLSPQGKTAVMVERSSVLTFPWSLRGKQGGAEHAYELALPSAPIQKLTLELPTVWRPIVPGAIVTRDDASSSASHATWQIELGQQSPSLLTLINPQDPASQSLVLLREANSANLGPAGLDISTTFTLDIHHQPLTRLEISCPRELDIASIRVGDKSLPFKFLPAQTGQQRISIELADPLLGVLRVINIQAIMPWMPGKPLTLPRLSVGGAVWQEGTASVSLAPSLELARLKVSGGRQTGVLASVGASGETYQLQFFSPQAKAEFLANSLAPTVRIESLGNVQLDPTQVSGVMTSRIRAERGETFDLQLDVSREWLVDSLDTTPPDVIEERTFVQAADGGQILQLRLKQAVREGQDLRLVVRARRRGAAVGEELGPDQFRFLRFLGDVSERRTLAVGVADSAYLVRVSGDGDLRRMALADFPASDVAAIGHSDEQLVFVDDELANSLRLKLQTEEPQFAAVMKVQATVDRDQVEEVYRVRLQPQGAALSEVLVRFGLPLRDPSGWQFTDSEETIAAQRIESSTEIANDSGETWRLRWKRARTESFEITSRARSSFSAAFPVNWLSMPAAAAQTGFLEFGAENGQLLAIEAPDLEAVPPPAPAPGNSSPVRAAYRYDPSRRVHATFTRRGPSEGQPALIVHAIDVQTRFQRNGRARHQSTVKLENLGIREISVRAPQAEGLIEWTVNGRQIAAIPVADGNGVWRIPLPEGASQATLQIVHSSPSQPFGWLGWMTWQTHLPQFEVPVLTSQWHVQLPPGVLRVSERWLPTTFHEIGKRLFGPLWRTGNYSFLGAEAASDHWTTIEDEITRSPATLSVCFVPACDAWGWASLLVTAAFGIAFRFRPAGLFLLIAGLLAVSAIVAPWPCVPYASGALLGLMSAGIVRLIAEHSVASEDGNRIGGAVSASSLASGLALLFYFASAMGLATAQAPAESQVEQQKRVPARRIIVPMDEDGEELPYVYVEPEFHAQLQRLAVTPAADAVTWLARSGDYRLEFQAAEADGKRRLESLTATFLLEMLSAEGSFRLPLPRDKVHLLPDGVRVNRSAVVADWSEDESELRVPLRGSGAHTVEIKLRPVLQRDGDYERLDLEIPAIATAQLTTAGTVPGDLELLKSAEHLSPAPSGEGLVARLGPVSRLNLRWSGASDNSSVATTEATQLIWWKIRPGGVTAEARFRLRPLSGKIRELKFKLDPRMRIVAWDCDHEVVSQRQLADEEQWRLALRLPADKEVTVRAQFLLTGTTGIGNLVLPQADIVADRMPQAWLGFSTAAGLTLDLDAVSQQNRIPPADFLANWGAADNTPEQACRIVSEGGSRSVVIRPEAGSTRYQSSYLGSFASDHLRLRWEAKLTETPSDWFEIPIATPDKSRILRVELLRGDTLTPVRFNEENPGKFIAHLTHPLEKGSVLAVEMDSPWPSEKAAPLPEVLLESALEETAEWKLYRQSFVLAEVTAPKGWTAAEGQMLGSWQENLGRLLGVWRRNEGTTPTPIICHVAPNEPQAVGRLITSVQRTPSGWQAEVRGDLEITGGQLDQLRLDVPAEWSGPFDVTPAHQVEVRESPQIGRRIVSLKPPQPLAGAWKFSLRGPLSASMGEGVRAPEALLLDLGEFERVLILPTRLEQQRVEWQTSGLQATEVPVDWPEAGAGNNGWEAFRAIASRFRATVKQVERFSGEPIVHLAEHQVTWNRSGRLAGESVFEVEPGGTAQVRLELPPQLDLVQVQVGPYPARLHTTDVGTWTVELNSDQWPQSVKVLYRMRPERTTSEMIAVPRLADLRVGNTLWSLRTSPIGGAALPATAAGISTEAKHLLVRLETLMIVARVIVDIGLTGESPEGLVDGWVNWRRRWSQVRNAVDSLPAAQKDSFFEAKLQSLEDEYQALLPRLPAGALAQDLSLAPVESSLKQIDDPRQQITRLAFTGSMPAIPIPTRREPSRIRPEWLMGGIGIVGCLVVLLAFSKPVHDWLVRWNYVAVAVAGAIWLAILQPTWVGILILLWAWSLAWNGWPGSQFLPADSGRRLPSGISASRTGV